MIHARSSSRSEFNATVVGIAIALFAASLAKADFLQYDCWGIRSPFDIDLFLSAQNDQAAVDKMSKAGQIKILRLASRDPQHIQHLFNMTLRSSLERLSRLETYLYSNL
jgi:hypothetical protein